MLNKYIFHYQQTWQMEWQKYVVIVLPLIPLIGVCTEKHIINGHTQEFTRTINHTSRYSFMWFGHRAYVHRRKTPEIFLFLGLLLGKKVQAINNEWNRAKARQNTRLCFKKINKEVNMYPPSYSLVQVGIQCTPQISIFLTATWSFLPTNATYFTLKVPLSIETESQSIIIRYDTKQYQEITKPNLVPSDVVSVLFLCFNFRNLLFFIPFYFF